MNIYVSNLNSETTEDQLAALVRPYGTCSVGKIRTIADSDRVVRKTYAFILMDDEAAKSAIEALNGKPFLGHPVGFTEAG